MTTPADRKQELERKKAKLAMIREEKKRKEAEIRQMLTGSNASPEKDLGGGTQKSEEVEKMLLQLGISPHPTTPLEDDGGSGEGGSARSSPARQMGAQSTESSPATMLYRTRGRVNLQKSEMVQVNLQPKEQVLYSKTTQTTADAASVDKDFVPAHTFEWDDEFHAAGVGVAASGSMASPAEEVFDFDASPTHQMAAGLLPHIELIRPAETVAADQVSTTVTGTDVDLVCAANDIGQNSEAGAPEEHGWRDFAQWLPSTFQFLTRQSKSTPSFRVTQPSSLVTSWASARYQPHVPLDKKLVAAAEEEKPKILPLTEDEKRNIMSSEDFQAFFDRTSRIIQRAMDEDVDIYIDYAKGIEQEKIDSGAKLSLNRCFYDDKWTKNRCVTSLDYSPQHPELLAVAYNNQEDAPHEPDGVVLVWNTKFKNLAPEYIFHCHSRVLSITWAKFHPNLLLGGTYNGQICLWDNRNNKRTPVQKSPLSATAHTHPVYCAQIVGTQNSHSLVTISTDGKLCTWSLDMLAKPQESMDLNMTSKQTKQVTATALSFPQNDVNNFMIGSEEGTVYSGCRHGQRAGIVEPFEGHAGPVTGLDFHASVAGQVDFSNLFLTSSFDWTVKLWSTKDSRPLYSFEDHSDYVLDVAWSPIHPALFACVDGRGRIDFWNLNQDTEIPAASLIVPDSPALNRLLWLQSGHQIAVGDDSGRIWIYDVNEQLANPKPNEWQTFAKTLNEFKQSQSDADDINSAMGMAISPRI